MNTATEISIVEGLTLQNCEPGEHPVSSLRPHEESLRGALERCARGSRRFAAGALGYAYFEGKKAAADLKSKAFTKVAAAGAAALLGFFAYAWLTGTVVYALSEAMPLWLAALIVAFLNVVGAYLFFRKLVGGAEREKSTQAQFTLDQRVRVLQAKLDPQGNFETHPFEHGDERSAVRQGKEMMSSAKLDIGDAARDLKRAASQTVSPRYQIQHRPLPILMGGFVVGALVGLGLSGQGARKSSGWTLNLKT